MPQSLENVGFAYIVNFLNKVQKEIDSPGNHLIRAELIEKRLFLEEEIQRRTGVAYIHELTGLRPYDMTTDRIINVIDDLDKLIVYYSKEKCAKEADRFFNQRIGFEKELRHRMDQKQ